MENEFYLQVGNSNKYLNVDLRYGYTHFNFTNILTKVISFPTEEKAQEALSLVIKEQEEIVAKCEKFYHFVYNATPEQKEKFYSVLYQEVTFIQSAADARNYMGSAHSYGIDYYIAHALADTFTKHPEFYLEEPFSIIKECRYIMGLEYARTSNWDESTKWFNLKKNSESYNKNWVSHYETNVKQLNTLKKCKPATPKIEHKIHFHKIRKPSWVKCGPKMHCSSCGANIAEMKYLSLPVGKSDRNTYICPICLVKIGNQVQELVDSVGQEMIEAHTKMLFIKSI